MPPAIDILPPRYLDARPIGRGGTGEIFAATDRELGRRVALKVLAARFAADTSLRARFEREALAAARLSGTPYIVTIFDVTEHAGRPIIVMELLPGGSLEAQIAGSPCPTAAALRWLDQAAGALDAAHAAGVVHRDVKPANLLLDGRARCMWPTSASRAPPGSSRSRRRGRFSVSPGTYRPSKLGASGRPRRATGIHSQSSGGSSSPAVARSPPRPRPPRRSPTCAHPSRRPRRPTHPSHARSIRSSSERSRRTRPLGMRPRSNS